jgi:hypothetical protein
LFCYRKLVADSELNLNPLNANLSFLQKKEKLKMQQTGQLMYGCNGQSRGIVITQQQQ